MHIIYFLTYDYSFKSWDEDGNLSREITYFKKFKEFDENIFYTFITFGDKNDMKYLESVDKHKIIPIYKYLPYFKNKYLRFFVSLYIPFKLKKLLNDVPIDIIKQNQLQGSWISILFKLLINKPLIIRTGYDVLTFKIKEKKSKLIILFYKLLTIISLKFSDLYTVTTNVDREFLNQNFKNHKKIKLRRNFVYLDENNFYNKNFSSRESKVICVGRLERQKNFNYLLEELKNQDIEIIIYGNGSEKQKLVKQSLNNKSSVGFKGQIDNKNIFKILGNSKFFISSSLYEGNPKSILEAMYCGCIVFASKTDNTSEIITNGKDGFLYNLEKDELRRSFLSNLLDDKQLESISRNARKRVEINNSIDTLVKLEISDFNNIIQK